MPDYDSEGLSMRISPNRIDSSCEFCKHWHRDLAAQEMIGRADWDRGYGVCHWRSRTGIIRQNGFKSVDMRHYSRSTSEDCWREAKPRSSIMTIMERRLMFLEWQLARLEVRLADHEKGKVPEATAKLKPKSRITKKLDPFSLEPTC